MTFQTTPPKAAAHFLELIQGGREATRHCDPSLVPNPPALLNGNNTVIPRFPEPTEAAEAKSGFEGPPPAAPRLAAVNMGVRRFSQVPLKGVGDCHYVAEVLQEAPPVRRDAATRKSPLYVATQAYVREQIASAFVSRTFRDSPFVAVFNEKQFSLSFNLQTGEACEPDPDGVCTMTVEFIADPDKNLLWLTNESAYNLYFQLNHFAWLPTPEKTAHLMAHRVVAALFDLDRQHIVRCGKTTDDKETPFVDAGVLAHNTKLCQSLIRELGCMTCCGSGYEYDPRALAKGEDLSALYDPDTLVASVRLDAQGQIIHKEISRIGPASPRGTCYRTGIVQGDAIDLLILEGHVLWADPEELKALNPKQQAAMRGLLNEAAFYAMQHNQQHPYGLEIARGTVMGRLAHGLFEQVEWFKNEQFNPKSNRFRGPMTCTIFDAGAGGTQHLWIEGEYERRLAANTAKAFPEHAPAKNAKKEMGQLTLSQDADGKLIIEMNIAGLSKEVQKILGEVAVYMVENYGRIVAAWRYR